ncbi:hypothetical protein BPOR_0655g00020 [Botrytis porri]|uniref:Uncharacterized protein n=1 Tax=Botrytis porri TaxID=87229 RepID=A0A4Z1KBC6_9HELO|nr:hypothetical protein BPOR_0655g00020 [Botrytis porri]
MLLDIVCERVKQQNESLHPMEFLDGMYEVAAHLDPIYPLTMGGKFQPSREVVWRTILADTYQNEQPAQQQCEELIAHYQEWVRNGVRNGSQAKNSMQRLSITEKLPSNMAKRIFRVLRKRQKLQMMLAFYFELVKAISALEHNLYVRSTKFGF